LTATVDHPGHQPTATAIDPVCGMSVDPASAANHAEHAGHRYFFCGARCRERFVAMPARFLEAKPVAAASAAAGQYTCPMHPEVVRDRPGNCPISDLRHGARTLGADCRRRARS
jgi:Cu+-exporting ATPase